MDLQREIPNIRTFALRRWHEAEQAAHDRVGDPAAQADENSTTPSSWPTAPQIRSLSRHVYAG